jgi:hypothetical protein
LLGADGTEGSEEFIVDCPCVIEKRSYNALDSLDACFVKWWACVRFREKLFLGAVNDVTVGVWRVLRLSRWLVVVFAE